MGRMFAFGIAVTVSSLLVAGCCKGTTDKKEEPAATSSAAASDDESTGVAECDDYFKKMKECYKKNPLAKASMEDTMKQMRQVFKTTAAMPGGKAQLKQQCTQHIQLLGQNPMCK